MSVNVELTGELANRVEQAAAARGVTPAELIVEAVTARLEDPLDAFIASGASGRGDLARRHRQIRAEHTQGHGAADL